MGTGNAKAPSEFSTNLPKDPDMNAKIRFLAVSALALLGTSAFAVEGEQPSTWMTPSTQSRVEVKAAALQFHEGSGTVVAASSGDVKRAQVVAEAREAIRLGLIPTYDGYSREATAAEQEQIRQAGLRAVRTLIAGK